MKELICYVPTKKDQHLAILYGWDPKDSEKSKVLQNPRYFASLRGLYDSWAKENGREPLCEEGKENEWFTAEEAVLVKEKIDMFKKVLQQSYIEHIKQHTQKAEKDWKALRGNFSLEKRKARINMIASAFSEVVDKLTKNGKVSRQVVANGFVGSDGNVVGGPVAILNEVYNTLHSQRALYWGYTQYENKAELHEKALRFKEGRFTQAEMRGLDDETRKKLQYEWANTPEELVLFEGMLKDRYTEYTKMLEYWNEFMPFVIRTLKDTEGVKINTKYNYASTASIDGYDEDQIADKWDISESKKEGWMENAAKQSAYKSVGFHTRRIISQTPRMQEVVRKVKLANGKEKVVVSYEPALDDLGCVIYLSPTLVHQELATFLTGMRSSEDMLKRLLNTDGVTAKLPAYQALVDKLINDPAARTQFYCDLKRNFQPYSKLIIEDVKDKATGILTGLKKIKTVLMNKSKNYLASSYQFFISARGTYPESGKYWCVYPVKNSDGTVNWDSVIALKKLCTEWFLEEDDKHKDEGIGKIAKVYTGGACPFLSRDPNASIVVNGRAVRITYEMKKDFISTVFASLGFDCKRETVEMLMHSPKIYQVRNFLMDLFTIGSDHQGGILTAMERTELYSQFRDDNAQTKAGNLEKLRNMGVKYASLYKSKPVKEPIDRLLQIIGDHQNAFRMEERVRYNDNTYYSKVMPSYLGDMLEDIQSYVNADDKAGLKNWLKENYLSDPYYVDNKFLTGSEESKYIKHYWLAELWEACNTPAKHPLIATVAGQFSYERMLGTGDKEFENFTSKEYAIDMMAHFWQDEEQNKGYEGRKRGRKMTSLYPMFILGDAGVSKYIRAPRITSFVFRDKNGEVVEVDEKGIPLDKDKFGKTSVFGRSSFKGNYEFDTKAEDVVLDQFWKIYQQERKRINLDKKSSTIFFANAKEVKNRDKFSILTFLNPGSDTYNPKYSIAGHENDEHYVKKVIRQYLDDAALNGLETTRNGVTVKTPSFKQRLENMGVLEKNKKGTSYIYLSQYATPDNIDTKVREYYWNTKLATALQLQMLTVDPSFYHGSKDLQKRYKEVHAPGTLLDIDAYDKYNDKLYSVSGKERMIYFKDVSVNSEKTNAEFAQSILRIFATADDAEVEKAIADGITVPLEDKTKDKARLKKIEALMGENYYIYDTYRKNTLTDGQGYRTLTGYRKVMGMSGKWSDDMEDTYQQIMEIRQNLRMENREELNEDEREKVAKLAAVFQPIKPYMFTHEKIEVDMPLEDGNGNPVMENGKPVTVKVQRNVPVQHKYAEAVIIPELLPKGSMLRDMGYWMEDHDIDMIGSDKISKVGCFGQADLSEVTDKESLNKALTNESTIIHELPYKDYRIQTNVPKHLDGSRLFGTQIRKLIMAGLNMRGDYSSYIDGKDVNLSGDRVHLNGEGLLALYNSVICANILDSFTEFANTLDDVRELRDLLQSSTMVSDREVMDNIFSYALTGTVDPKFDIALFEGGLEHDSIALILSVFKKLVNKQQILGGSAVQVSAMGLEGYERSSDLRYVTDPDNAKNVLYAEIEMPFERTVVYKYTTVSGKKVSQKVELHREDYCFTDSNYDGYMLPSGEPIEKDNPEYRKYLSYTYKKVNGELVPCKYDDPEAKVYKPLIETKYPGILNVIAYRIPTEKEYSMMNCVVKRFSSSVAGGTLKCPPEGTGIAGFDFDIDKLYFMLKNFELKGSSPVYTESHFTKKELRKIWEYVYKNNPGIEAELYNTRDKAHQEGKISDFDWRFKPLNTFWEEADITGKFGLDKQATFADAAIALGFKPKFVDGESPTEGIMEEYDFSKSPEDNSVTARNNLLVHLISQRLMDPETAQSRYTPGGFSDFSDAARFIRELQYGNLNGVHNADGSINFEELEGRKDSDTDPEPNYDITDPYTILYYNEQNQLAGKLIGIFANENANHAFARNLHKLELKEPISFCGHSYSDLLHKNDSMMALRVSVTMAEYLAASVDAVKDPVLNFLNLNTITSDAGAVLARLGYTPQEIGLLFNQPVIKYLCEETLNSGKKINTVILDFQNDLMGQLVGEDLTRTIPLDRELLAGEIIKERLAKEQSDKTTTKEWVLSNARNQYEVLQLFSEILKVSRDISELVLNTKFTAANSVKSTAGSLYAQRAKMEKYIEKFPKSGNIEDSDVSYEIELIEDASARGITNVPINDDEDYLKVDKATYLKKVRWNPFAYEQCMYDCNRKLLQKLKKYYPYENPVYNSCRGVLNAFCLWGSLNEDEINDIHAEMTVAFLARQEGSIFDGEAPHKENGYTTGHTNREYYREVFAEKLFDILSKNPVLRNLEIFKYLYPTPIELTEEEVKALQKEGKSTEKWEIEMQEVGAMNAEVKDSIMESWSELALSENEDYQALAADLFMYCFYQQGFRFSPYSFMHLAPTEVKERINLIRPTNLTINDFDFGEIKAPTNDEPSDDVLVWNDRVTGSWERASDEFNSNPEKLEELNHQAYRMPAELDYNSIRNLCEIAKKNPSLKFKVDFDLTSEELEMLKLNNLGVHIPANIYFNSATAAAITALGEEVSYGREVTYRDFLYMILNGSENSIDPQEFAFMFILNHTDNSKFVLDINKCNEDVKKIFSSAIKTDYVEYDKETDSYLLDISKFTESSKEMEKVKSLVTYDEQTHSYKWAPCIKLRNKFYIPIADGNSYSVVGKSPKIRLQCVMPLGTNKSLTVGLSHPTTIRHQMAYKTSLNAIANAGEDERPVTPVTPTTSEEGQEETQGQGIGNAASAEELTSSFNGSVNSDSIKEFYIEKFAEEMTNAEIKAGRVMVEEKESRKAQLKEAYKEADMADILETAAILEKACRDAKDNILVLDAEGNLTTNC